MVNVYSSLEDLDSIDRGSESELKLKLYHGLIEFCVAREISFNWVDSEYVEVISRNSEDEGNLVDYLWEVYAEYIDRLFGGSEEVLVFAI